MTRPRDDAPDAAAAGQITIEGLTIAAGSKVLLAGADGEFPAGKITLIVGPSGVGKSLLLKTIAGLVHDRTESLDVHGRVLVDGTPTRPGRVGVVFQSYALLDELTPLGNVQFARDHAAQRVQPTQAQGSEDVAKSAGDDAHGEHSPRTLLDALQVPTDVRTVHLSGGQRQRLAIARALAYDPPAVLYDEPTSGLDPHNARRVAELIRDTQREYNKTAVIVTHDYQSLVSIADRVYILNPIDKRLDLVPPDQWSQLDERLEPLSQHLRSARDDGPPVARPSSSRGTLDRWAVATTGIAEAAVVAAVSLIPTWKSWRWGLRFLAYYARLVAGPTAWFYVAMTGIIIGFVTTYYVFEFLPYADYTEPLLVDDLLSVLGFALYRIIVPVMATILIAARCGAAVAADIGSKQYGNQFDAMATFGARPRAYLLTPIMLSFLVGTPLLVLIAFWTARLVSLYTFTITHPEHGPDFWYQYFHRGLAEVGQWWYHGSSWMLLKVIASGLGVAMIAYFRGRAPKWSTNDVSRGVTATILWATLYVLVVHYWFAFYEFRGQMR